MLSAFENAFTHAPIGMALVDMAGRVLRVNDALARITGYSSDELCTRLFRDLPVPQDVSIDAVQLAELLDGQTAAYQIEKRFRHVGGQMVWVLQSVSLVRDDAGRPMHLIAQVQNISERKELEGRLEHLVDHDFLTALFNGRRFEVVVDAIVGIAKGMGKKTVPEFVINQDMIDRLRRSGVDYAQGFHIGAPQPVGEVFDHRMMA